MPVSRRKWPSREWPGRQELRNGNWISCELQGNRAPPCPEPSTKLSCLRARANRERHKSLFTGPTTRDPAKGQQGRRELVDALHPQWLGDKSVFQTHFARFPAVRPSVVQTIRNTQSSPEHFIFSVCENHKIDSTGPIASFRTAWRNATKKERLPGPRFHDLCHTAITKLAESMTNERTIMAIAGHVSRRMLEGYSYIRMDANRTAVEAIGQRIPEGSGAQNRTQSRESQRATALTD